MDTKQRLRQFLVEELRVQPKDIATDESPLISNHVIDSLGISQIVSFLEDEFELLVADEEIVRDNFETIDAITRLVESKRG